MAKAPAFQFYPSDWQRDLSEHPLEIEGAWIRICCALWWSDTPGKSTKPLTNWARILRVGEKKSLSIISYLLKQNIAEIVIQNESITITSRRMLKDEYIRNIRRNAGSMGGNPSLKKNENNTILLNQDLLNQKQTPSSSSSTSNNKTINNKAFVLPDWIPKEPWDGFVEMRKEIKKPINGRALTLAINKLADLKKRGNEPGKVLDQSTLGKWQGLYELKEGGNYGSGNNRRTGAPFEKTGRTRGNDGEGGNWIPPEYKGEPGPVVSPEEAQRNLDKLRGIIDGI